MEWLKQIFCFHSNWNEGYSPSYHRNSNLVRWCEMWWHCTKCKKNKRFDNDNPPIQYLED